MPILIRCSRFYFVKVKRKEFNINHILRLSTESWHRQKTCKLVVNLIMTSVLYDINKIIDIFICLCLEQVYEA